jgi:dTDP-glucose 4,6-dehydratase
MKILVTGGAGFIGSNFVKYLLSKYPHYEIVNLDKLTYAGNLDNLSEVKDNSNHRFIKGDICDQRVVEDIVKDRMNVIVNFAAETHVDRSLYDPKIFAETNVLGTQVLLESALKFKTGRFIQISTDEVYGSSLKGRFNESSLLSPNSPYAASKASADLLTRSYHKTFGLAALIARSTNNYGPHQFPEKLIPLFITNALSGQELPLYGDGLYVRDWLYVEDHCRALDLVLHKGGVGQIYNIGGNCEKTNLEIAELILGRLNKPKSLIKHVKDRPAHDRRYSLDCSKMGDELGWKPDTSFERGLAGTVDWYIANQKWWEKIKTGEYLEYYRKHYVLRDSS